MAKQLTITDPTSGVTYTLEYTRKTVEMMEKQGFSAENRGGLFFSKDGYIFCYASNKWEQLGLNTRFSDYVPIPVSAEVGQFIKVSSVDEVGKVTSTEAVTILTYSGETGDI